MCRYLRTKNVLSSTTNALVVVHRRHISNTPCHKYSCVGTPVTRLCITHDDQFLVAADEASCLFVFDVRDRQDRGPSSSKLGGSDLQPLATSEVTFSWCDTSGESARMGEMMPASFDVHMNQ